jgi:hypothetical protein
MNRSRSALLCAAATALAAATLAPSPSASAATNDLAGWWPMNEGSGQVVRDWSLSGNRGVLGATAEADAGDPAWFDVGSRWLRRSALRFDGNDRVRMQQAPSLEPDGVTVLARVRSTVGGSYRYVLSKGAISCEAASYGLYTGADGGLVFYVSDGSRYTLSADAGPGLWDGAWHTVRGTFDGSSVRLFVDGVEVGSPTPAPVSIGYGLPDGGELLLGDYAGPCGSPLGFVGDVDAAALVGHYDLGTGLPG